MKSPANSLIYVTSDHDPDDARRRTLLNILLIGLMSLSALVLVVATILLLTKALSPEEIKRISTTAFLMMLCLGGIYAINRYVSGRLASWLFVLFMVLILSQVDAPEEIINGRSLYLFTIPIIASSVLLFPVASFVIAAVSSVVIEVLRLTGETSLLLPNVLGMAGFFAVALVAWLSARSMENALRDLRVLNAELDQRVADRTRELSAALSRERAEAGKSQAILNSIADGVIVFDPRGQAIVANPSIAALLDLPLDKMVGFPIEDLVKEKLPPIEQEQMIKMLHSGETHSGTRFNWGEKKTLSVSFATVRDTDGAILGTVVVFRDFTREAELERMKSAFVSMVSHELRTPLNAILGYVEMMLAAVVGPLTERQRKIMERMFANSQQLLNIVNDLLSQAQIEAGKLSLNYTNFSPAQLLYEVNEVMAGFARAKQLELIVCSPEGLPESIYGDQQRLQQILINLVNNAIKFTDQGSITLNLQQPDNDHWALEVIDTGVGIPADEQRRIFEPFRQVNTTDSRSAKGVGLGLAIVKELVTLMKGEIHLDSKVGKGSQFTVVLPLNKQETA